MCVPARAFDVEGFQTEMPKKSKKVGFFPGKPIVCNAFHKHLLQASDNSVKSLSPRHTEAVCAAQGRLNHLSLGENATRKNTGRSFV
jgi:hypothetical protein